MFQTKGKIGRANRAMDPLTYRTEILSLLILCVDPENCRLKARPNTDVLSACRHSRLHPSFAVCAGRPGVKWNML